MDTFLSFLCFGHSVVQIQHLLKQSIFLNSYSVLLFFSRRPIHQAIGRSEKEDSEFYHSPSVLVYTFHLAFMTVFGFTSMHVQVSVNKFLQKFSNYCKMRSVCSREMNVGRWSGFLKNAFHAFVPKHKTACTTKQSLGTNLKLFGFFTQNAK